MISSYRTNKKKFLISNFWNLVMNFSIYYQSLSTYSYPYSISNMIYFTQMQFSFLAYKCVYVCELVMCMMAPSFCVLVLTCGSFCLLLLFFSWIKWGFNVGSSILYHVTVMSNTTCTARVLLRPSLELLIFRCRMRTLVVSV